VGLHWAGTAPTAPIPWRLDWRFAPWVCPSYRPRSRCSLERPGTRGATGAAGAAAAHPGDLAGMTGAGSGCARAPGLSWAGGARKLRSTLGFPTGGSPLVCGPATALARWRSLQRRATRGATGAAGAAPALPGDLAGRSRFLWEPHVVAFPYTEIRILCISRYARRIMRPSRRLSPSRSATSPTAHLRRACGGCTRRTGWPPHCPGA